MTANQFRRIALSLPDTAEHSHMNHPDFRAGGRIFATLGYPDVEWGMIKLSPEEQNNFVQSEPHVFVPVRGAWGLKGCTNVNLKRARSVPIRRALDIARRLALARNPSDSARYTRKTGR